jgi:hypothetical protein
MNLVLLYSALKTGGFFYPKCAFSMTKQRKRGKKHNEKQNFMVNYDPCDLL